MVSQHSAAGPHLATAVPASGGMPFGYDVGVLSVAILFVEKALAPWAGTGLVVFSSVRRQDAGLLQGADLMVRIAT